MAQTINDYYNQIRNEAIAQATAAGNASLISMLDNTSRVAVWKILFYAVAFACFLIDTLFDRFRAETDDKIKLLKPGTLDWWAEKVKTFQYGDNLVPEKDYYDNTGQTESQIEAKKIVKYAAAIEQSFSNGRFGVRLKLAGEDGTGDRIKLDNVELAAVREFVKRFHPAGVYWDAGSGDADHLKLVLKVYYNPLVLNSSGQRLDGNNNTPLQTAINDHLENLPFNGRFNLTKLVDAMQAVEGISDPRIVAAQTQYAALPYADVIDETVPDAGYLKIYDPADLTITWIPKSAI